MKNFSFILVVVCLTFASPTFAQSNPAQKFNGVWSMTNGLALIINETEPGKFLLQHCEAETLFRLRKCMGADGYDTQYLFVRNGGLFNIFNEQGRVHYTTSIHFDVSGNGLVYERHSPYGNRLFTGVRVK